MDLEVNEIYNLLDKEANEETKKALLEALELSKTKDGGFDTIEDLIKSLDIKL